MKALFLAAGFSTRLYPLTENFPKGLLDIAGQPIIERLMSQVVRLNQAGLIDEIAVITNSRCYDDFHSYLENQIPVPVHLIDNQVENPDERLGAIGDLELALDLLDWQDEVLVLPSDTLCSVQLQNLLSFYATHSGFTNVVFDTQNPEIIKDTLGCVTLEKEKIVSFTEKPSQPESSITSVPIYMYPKASLQLIKEYVEDEKNNLDSPGAIVPWLVGKIDVYGYMLEGYYHDVGTVEKYEAIKADPKAFLTID